MLGKRGVVGRGCAGWVWGVGGWGLGGGVYLECGRRGAEDVRVA